ncbi:lysozyme [Drosophila subobscura]|uniref:lysozyme n=1 Tax=Drosophila subobscura TaxID=7241 RepID=UPI00155B1280|nr:lysozyme [Drosophila subobscura]
MSFVVEYLLCLLLAVSPLWVQSEDDVLDKPVTELCLTCICEAISGCNATRICTNPEKGACGIFRITWGYWVDAGKLTLDGEHPDAERAFINCANDPHCAANVVQNYMKKFNQDCNEDGEMDCHDYARIHKLGAYGCQADLPYNYQSTFEECIENYEDQGIE